MTRKIIKVNPILGMSEEAAILEAGEFVHDEVENGYSRQGPIGEFLALIEERYEDFPMHSICKACKLSRRKKKACYQTEAPGLYRFVCTDKKQRRKNGNTKTAKIKKGIHLLKVRK